MHLPPDGELWLEVAEDFAELLKSPDGGEQLLHAVQVKDTRESGSVTLNSADVLKTIESLFRLQEKNPGRPVFMTFMTTSPIGMEQRLPLPCGLPALDVWRAASEGGDAVELLGALRTRFPTGEFGDFLRQCSEQDFRDRLITRLRFACDKQSLTKVEQEGRAYLVKIRDIAKAEPDAARRAYDALLGILWNKVVSSRERYVSHQDFVDAFAEATAFSLPSQAFAELLLRKDSTADSSSRRETLVPDDETLVLAARQLLTSSRPPSLLHLFSGVDETVRSVLDDLANVERWVTSSSDSKDQSRQRLPELLKQENLHHLFSAPPGAGKTHALWHLAAGLIGNERNDTLRERDSRNDEGAAPHINVPASGVLIPMLISVGGLRTAEDALKQIQATLPGYDVSALLRDPRICVLIDGWSEFATGENFQERATLLRAFAQVRIIACARYADASDTFFNCWSLDLLTPSSVRASIERAVQDPAAMSDEFVDLLRFPLMLSLYLLLGGAMSDLGELLAHFHRHVSKRIPEEFGDVLVDAVSSMTLQRDRSYQRFLRILRGAAVKKDVLEPESRLERLGTIEQRGNVAVAIHDLYWSWLSGVGLLRESRVRQAALLLDTRESLELALQSGEPFERDLIGSIARVDTVLAATFDRSLRESTMDASLSQCLDAMHQHPDLSVRCRAAAAGFRSGRSNGVRRALETLSELTEAKVYVPDLIQELEVATLFANRGVVAGWVGRPGTQIVMDTIAAKGDARWVPWVEQMLYDGRIESHQAVGTALACGGVIPKWTTKYLTELVAESPAVLRFTSDRGVNVEFAHWMVDNFPQSQETPFGCWQFASRVVVGCGDSTVFEKLLERFPSMTGIAQQALGMVIPELGHAWTARFQKILFARTGATVHHRLATTLSLDIDDFTAREWIAQGYYLEGWRVLTARHGAKVLPELVAQLPESFGGHASLPALQAIALLKEAPESLLDALHARVFNSTTQQLGLAPMVGESVIRAAAVVKASGIIWLIRPCLQNPRMYGGYHAKLLLEMYAEWKRETRQTLMLEVGAKKLPFERWFVTVHFINEWDEHFSPEALRMVPEMAVEVVLTNLSEDDNKAAAVLTRLGSLVQYDHALFERMIRSSKLISLIPKVFADTLNSLPPKQFLRLVASDSIKLEDVIYQLGSANDPSFQEAHAVIISKLISGALDLSRTRIVANMLRRYPRDALLEMICKVKSDAKLVTGDNLHWLLRETGAARRELLVDETGELLH